MYGILGNDQGLSYAAAALPVNFGVVGMSFVALNYGSYQKRSARGGPMKFVEFETIYRDREGDVVVRSRTTVVQTEGVVEES